MPMKKLSFLLLLSSLSLTLCAQSEIESFQQEYEALLKEYKAYSNASPSLPQQQAPVQQPPAFTKSIRAQLQIQSVLNPLSEDEVKAIQTAHIQSLKADKSLIEAITGNKLPNTLKGSSLNNIFDKRSNGDLVFKSRNGPGTDIPYTGNTATFTAKMFTAASATDHPVQNIINFLNHGTSIANALTTAIRNGSSSPQEAGIFVKTMDAEVGKDSINKLKNYRDLNLQFKGIINNAVKTANFSPEVASNISKFLPEEDKKSLEFNEPLSPSSIPLDIRTSPAAPMSASQGSSQEIPSEMPMMR